VRQIASLRAAALDLISMEDLRDDAFALVAFASGARLLCAPTHEAGQIRAAVEGLAAGGTTNLARGLELAREVLAASTGERWILLFTDGKPRTQGGEDPVAAARLAAEACRDSGIGIVAVGTGLADRPLLEEITADPARVFLSAPGALGDAFRSSGELIGNRQMLASRPTATDLAHSVVRTSAWAGLLALGAGLALLMGQNRHLRRRTRPGLVQLAALLAGAAATGLAAGAVGQGTFYALSGVEALVLAARVVAWTSLGCGIVLGMSFFVPNLPRVRAALGGAAGGAAAALCFLRIVPEVGDAPGRLLSAAILGLFAGAMTVLVEASLRGAWLSVDWGNGETSSLALGPTPIVVGRSASAHICPSWDGDFPPVIGRFLCSAAGVAFEDRRTGKRRRLRAGERLEFGPVAVQVRDSASVRGRPG
jgi:Ca-activated chloride channel family protein